jgi:uncharacterized membrane protein YfcA
MEPFDWIALGTLAVVTSMLTAMVGLGGGIILLAAMLLWFEPLAAIPLHGAIQLVSNGSRTWIQRRHVRWPILARFSIPLVPAGLLGLAVARAVPQEGLTLAIGVFVLLATWAPASLWVGLHPERADPNRRFLWLGAAVGFLNVIVGATGPLQGPFFRNLGLPRQGVVGTFAASQTVGHAVKIALFGALGFAFAAHALLLAMMMAGVVAGTWLGSKLLDRIDEVTFRRVYRAALTLVALRLIVWDGLELLGVVGG